MKFLWGAKDGGPESKVFYYGIESKRFGSICLLLFKQGSRECYHSHAFESLSWVLSGGLREIRVLRELEEGPLPDGVFDALMNLHFPSLSPIRTRRTTVHKVYGLYENNWVLSLRGPWDETWFEWHPIDDKFVKLTHGRKIVEGQ